MADDLQWALGFAATADRITSARFGASDLAVTTKPDLTPVSDADRAVEALFRQALAADRPGDAVVGEEFGEDTGGLDASEEAGIAGASEDTAAAGGPSRRWVIDPIDGTKNFVRGVPVWATLIALLEDGVPVVGVVSAPALGRRWWAARGAGAWTAAAGDEQPRRISVSGVGDLADASLSYSSLGGWAERGLLDRFLALTDRVWRTRAYGDFWSYMLLAEGAVDLAAEPELSLWDMAALYPVVTEAGGRFTGLDGIDGVHGGAAAASNGVLHEALLECFEGRTG